VVAAGPYRWVRNPICLAALLIVVGEAWLFLSLRLLAYAVAMAVLFHLFVIGYEEPTLRRRFGSTYLNTSASSHAGSPVGRATVRSFVHTFGLFSDLRQIRARQVQEPKQELARRPCRRCRPRLLGRPKGGAAFGGIQTRPGSHSG
jgi:Phospholipid methyltransferase